MKMKLYLLLLAAVAAVVSCSGPSDSGSKAGAEVERIGDEVMATMREFSAAVKTATNLSTTMDAAATMKALGNRFPDYIRELSRLEVAPPEVRQRISAKLKAHNEAMQDLNLSRAHQQLDARSSKILRNAVDEFFAKMVTATEEFSRHFEIYLD